VSASLVAIVGGLGAVHLAAYYGGQRALAGTVKAIPILLLAWTVWTHGDHGGVRTWIALGLVLSAIGDVSLVFPNGFLAGLSGFFAAHVCYVAAFATGATPTAPALLVAAILAAFAVGMLGYLWPHVARLRVPVTAYVACLSLMAWCAIARAMAPAAGWPETAGALGACSFLASDGVLSVDRFARRFAAAHAVVMVTYYAAQTLIARAAL
jgi:uncharacterized membrane protein YhhN